MYQDPTGQQQGPFPRSDIELWFKQGYFNDTLPIRLSTAPAGAICRNSWCFALHSVHAS